MGGVTTARWLGPEVSASERLATRSADVGARLGIELVPDSRSHDG